MSAAKSTRSRVCASCCPASSRATTPFWPPCDLPLTEPQSWFQTGAAASQFLLLVTARLFGVAFRGESRSSRQSTLVLVVVRRASIVYLVANDASRVTCFIFSP
jgi:hypothetical protein